MIASKAKLTTVIGTDLDRNILDPGDHFFSQTRKASPIIRRHMSAWFASACVRFNHKSQYKAGWWQFTDNSFCNWIRILFLARIWFSQGSSSPIYSYKQVDGDRWWKSCKILKFLIILNHHQILLNMALQNCMTARWIVTVEINQLQFITCDPCWVNSSALLQGRVKLQQLWHDPMTAILFDGPYPHPRTTPNAPRSHILQLILNPFYPWDPPGQLTCYESFA